MRFVLAAMPWQAMYRPSMPLGLLHSLLVRDCPDIAVAEYHGGLRWGEHLVAESPPAIDPDVVVDEYGQVAETGFLNGLGDMIFTGCLLGDDRWRLDELVAAAALTGITADSALRMRAAASAFIDAAAREILSTDPDIVGLTSTFMQNVPSLAVSRRLKQIRPELRIILGGANCEGTMGHALHRNHDFVDFVVRGEAEQVLPQLLCRIESDDRLDDLPGLCWWDDDASIANPQATHSVPPALVPAPDFEGWHQIFEISPLREYLTPELVIEGSRGCWWGEKHHCTFCGLNGALMAYRSKPAEQFWSELRSMVERHQILDVSAVDNILDMEYFRTLLPLMQEADWDLRIHFEVKSNLRADQITALAQAGIVVVQPGIESLSSRVLALMNKGVGGAANVQTLRNCEDNAMTVDWNYLYGFPGERAEDYTPVIDQMPALVHLQPPFGATRISLERYSPYFERPELGFGLRRALPFYRPAYNLPDDELFDLAYFFACDDAGITGDLVTTLGAAIDDWRQRYPTSALTMEVSGAMVEIQDRREGWPHRRHRLDGWRAAAYRILGRRITAMGLVRKLAEDGQVVPPTDVTAWLDEALADGLVFTDESDWVALATRTEPMKVPSTQSQPDEMVGVQV